MAQQRGRFPTATDSGFRLAINVLGNTITGKTVPEYLSNVLSFIEQRGLLDRLPLPFGTSGDNYLIAATPQQPSGAPFNAFVEYCSKGKAGRLYLNTNHPRFFALRQGARLLEAVGLSVSLPSDLGA